MRQTTHAFLKVNYFVSMGYAIIFAIVSVVMMISGVTMLVGSAAAGSQASSGDGVASLWSIFFFTGSGVSMVIGSCVYAGLVVEFILACVFSFKALEAVEAHSMPLYLGILCIIFAALPVGGILYIIYRSTHPEARGLNVVDVE